ncbi:hypothetical protein CAEBREN_17549 [Caenorhabditis brenneri]|uniref:Uncharacterized protein n=1 Tax=Caenorhabditis brenneri TaxID=135651 RepID=G0NGK3_CAEBE|nr:hypothetical protein CAEBREN_17549 [Caenorhabditis brenneri]
MLNQEEEITRSKKDLKGKNDRIDQLVQKEKIMKDRAKKLKWKLWRKRSMNRMMSSSPHNTADQKEKGESSRWLRSHNLPGMRDGLRAFKQCG